MKKYIGLDVHKDATSIAVLNGVGKLVMESIIETKAATVLEFLHGLRGELHVTLEEGTWAAWLYDVLKPHVEEIVVCNPRRNALLKEGSKSDKVDARKLAELLRAGPLRAVYHGENGLRALRELARSYLTISKDQARVMSRLKALYRSWGIACPGRQVYTPRHRDHWLSKIAQPGVRRRAELFYQQLDGLSVVRHTMRGELLAENRKHQAVKILRQIPLIGPLRAALLLALMQTAPPVPQQAAAVDLQRSGSGDARQRAASLCGWTTATFQKAATDPRSESKSQPRDEEDLQKYGHERQLLCGTTAGLLRRIAGQGDEAGYGSPHSGTQDRGHHVDTLEKRRTFRRRTSEIVSSLSVDRNQASPVYLPDG
jgi:hypothetical protein